MTPKKESNPQERTWLSDEENSLINILAAHAPEAPRPVSPYPSLERFAQAHTNLERVC